MTTDPQSPDTPASAATGASTDEFVDLLASRLVDGDVQVRDLPPDTRSDIERRAAEFAAFRSRLGDPAQWSESSALREAHIATALGSTTRLRSVSRAQFGSARFAMAAAASIICVVAVTGIVLRQGDSNDVEVFTDSVAADSQIQGALEQPAPELALDGGSSKSTPATMDAIPTDAVPIDDEEVPLPIYPSLDDIARVASSLPPGGSMIEGLNQSVQVPQCAMKSTEPLRIEVALLDGARVEIHFRDRGEFIVYDMSDCSTLASRPALP
jgi:hypothetical protein